MTSPIPYTQYQIPSKLIIEKFNDTKREILQLNRLDFPRLLAYRSSTPVRISKLFVRSHRPNAWNESCIRWTKSRGCFNRAHGPTETVSVRKRRLYGRISGGIQERAALVYTSVTTYIRYEDDEKGPWRPIGHFRRAASHAITSIGRRRPIQPCRPEKKQRGRSAPPFLRAHAKKL